MATILEVVQKVMRIRVKPNVSKANLLPIAKQGDMLGDFLEGLEGSNLVDMSELQKFRTMASDRESQYRIYDEMTLDSIIASALELYADDATQYNSKQQIIWAESSDNDISAFANRLIDTLSLNDNAWSHIYTMVKYGDLYLETFRDNETNDDPLLNTSLSYADVDIKNNKKGSVMEEYIEAVSDPSIIFDLTKRGKTVGYIKTQMNDSNSLDPRYSYQHIQQAEREIVLPADKYIHIALASKTDRFPEQLNISFEDDESLNPNDNIKTYTYNINRGKSILHDIFKIYKELKLMEDSLLLNRVTRSSIIRLLQIEVGDMPKAQARELLKRVKQMVEQKNYMDKNDGTYTSMASPGPIDNILYIPTHEGKGNITASNLGGDVDVKSISDIDYFKNKMYGGIKIPKQFLGDTSDPAGFSGGTSLTKLDSRYARTIKRVQSAYINGITTLINLFALSKGLEDHVNNFVIKMVSPSTVEDQERDEIFDSRVTMIGNFMSLLNSNEMLNEESRKEILMLFMNNYLSEPEVAEIIGRDTTIEDLKKEKENEENSSEDEFDESFESKEHSGMSTVNFDRSTPDFTHEAETDDDRNENFASGDFSDTEIPLTSSNLDTRDNSGFGNFEEEF